MADETIIAGSQSQLQRWKAWLPQVDSGGGGLALLILVSALVVLPPFFYLIKSSFTVPLPGFRTAVGLENYQRVVELSGIQLWGATVGFALGSSVLAIVLGFSVAWLLARTNVPLRQTVFVAAFLSLAHGKGPAAPAVKTLEYKEMEPFFVAGDSDAP
jgi:ABC-type spermidine/putrescine transport system permease subunit I